MHRARGTFIVAMSDGLPIGCVGLKGSGGGVAEIKRLWIAPAARGLGLGRHLMDAAESAARELSIKVLRLDTNSVLPEAGQLYRSSGGPRSSALTTTRTRICSSKSGFEI
jgi:GNAT superfamily N-acetyltransferase